MKTVKEFKESTEDMDEKERKEFYKKENVRNGLYFLDAEAEHALYYVIVCALVVIFFIFSAWFVGTYMMTPIGMLTQGIALGVFAKNLLESLFKLEYARSALKKFRIYNDFYGEKK